MINRQKLEEHASYMRDFVFAANDGIITTFAVVAGAYGAGISSTVVIVLGAANLLADGISMASGNYLSLESEMEFKSSREKQPKAHAHLLLHAFITFLSFVVAGSVPLLPFIFRAEETFYFSMAMVVLALMGLGFARSLAAKKDYVRSVLETSIVGGTAAVLAFAVGKLLESIIA